MSLSSVVTLPGRAPDSAPSPRRRRRPSGEAPPLPYDLGRSGRRWAWLGGAGLAFWASVMFGFGDTVNRLDNWLLRGIVSLRTDAATAVAQKVALLGSPNRILVLQWLIIVVALVFKRVRHLTAFLGCVLLTSWVTSVISSAFARPRPDVEILGSWTGFSHPSRPLAMVAVGAVGMIYVVVPRGRLRCWAKAFAGLQLGLLVAARLYLGVDHPTDALMGVIMGVAVTLVVFRVFVPTDTFPVRYRRSGNTAHLDIGGTRGVAILGGLRDQLGLDATAVKPFGLDGSAGSTPLQITLGDGTKLFGKLYAKNHLRSDRWYKLFRTLVYGRLEDESSFSSVRRLVQYEDYLLRLMHCSGIPTARPYGFIEITPEREYLLVTEFFDGAKEIGDEDVVVDDAVIDSGLAVVRQMWDAGLAHRDVKPANILVRNGQVLVIDVAFGEVRPSPWRQAVDLANMMLVLGLRSDPVHVYERAVLVFRPEEIGEAFAATRGIALTSQLRARLRQDGRNLVCAFRELAPIFPAIRIQRWSLRRLGLTTAVLVSIILVVQVTVGALQGAELLR